MTHIITEWACEWHWSTFYCMPQVSCVIPCYKSAKECLLAQPCVYNLFVYAPHIVCSYGVNFISVQVFLLGIHHTSAILEALLSFHNQLRLGKWNNEKNALTNFLGIMTCPYLVLLQRRMLYLNKTWLFIKLLSVVYKHITTACHVLIDVDIYVSKSAVFNSLIESTTPGSPFNCYGLTLILAWIRDYINYKVWHAIIYQCPNFIGASPHFTRRWLLIHIGIKVKPR